MSEDRRLTLQKERGGYVDTNLLPAEGGCNLLCLTDRQVAIIRSFVFPMVRWPTRWLTPVHGELYDTDSDTLFLLADEIDDLDIEVNGGHNVPCQSLADALGDLITIANSAGSLGSVLANVPDADWFGPDAETPPDEGVPPDGFETWTAYRVWKCQAAWAVWNELDRVMLMLTGFYFVEAVASAVVPTVFAFTAMSWVTVPPVGLLILATSILAMVAVWVSAETIMDQMRAWWSEHKDGIICQLYNSGDAATALAAIGDDIEDAIQAIEWGALVPFAGPLGDALGTAIGVFQNNSLVNPLFKLITGVVLYEVECPCSEPSGTEWHFDESAAGWTYLGVGGGGTVEHGIWQGAPPVNDPGDSSPGCLETFVDLPDSGGTWGQTEWQHLFGAWERPVAAAGMAMAVDSKGPAYANNIFLVIDYAEGGYDDGHWLHDAWASSSVPVSAGNYGKHISGVRLGAYVTEAHREPCYWYFDNVRLTGF